MSAPETTVTVRMYDVGFGDALLVTVRQGEAEWRMLVDCGAVSASRTRPLEQSVERIVEDLSALAATGSPPRLDVIVATHHHVDHIAGFAYPAWERVEVGEVWVPYVEDPDDEDAKNLRAEQTAAAHRLQALIEAVGARLAADDAAGRKALDAAQVFAANSAGDDVATDRLLGRNGKQFLNKPAPRYLPFRDPARNVIQTGLPGVAVHVLGPSRDPADVKRMKPPKAVQWLDESLGGEEAGVDPQPLFDVNFAVRHDSIEIAVPELLLATHERLKLDELSSADDVLAAASILENSVNNTSVFFVLDVCGTRLVFVGDSQHGAWEHVLRDPVARALVTSPAVYKVGHHGSHNATPVGYVTDELLGHARYALVPFRPVKRWPSIPEPKLQPALEALGVTVVHSFKPAGDGVVLDESGFWSEIRLTVP